MESRTAPKIKRSTWVQMLKKNAFNIVLVIFFGSILISSDAKSWLLRQLMVTGLFNAKIEEKGNRNLTQISANFDYRDEKDLVQNTASLHGKVVFINFWASWCPPCWAEMPAIARLYSQFKNNPAVVFLMINEDEDQKEAQHYLQKEQLNFHFYRAASAVPSSIFSGSLPTTVVIDKKGKLRLRHEGFANYGTEKFSKQIEALINE